MKNIIIIICLALSIVGCKKESGTENITIQYSITASSDAEKFIDSDKPRFSFTGSSYNGTYTLQKGTTMSLQCSYGSSQPGQTIRLVVSKDGATIADETKENSVSIQMIP